MNRISRIATPGSLSLLLGQLRSAFLIGGIVAVASLTGQGLAQQQLKIVSGGHQLTSYASAFPAPLAVAVTDTATGAEVSGVWVRFTPSAVIGLSASSIATDEHGLASVSATGIAACLAPCTASVTAEITGYPQSRIQLDGLSVEKAPLTIVPGDLQSTEGILPAISQYEIRGFLNGDTPESAGVTGDPVLTTTASETSPAANYAIKGGIGTLSAPNYRFVAGFGVLAVFDGPGSAERRQEELRRREEAARSLVADQPEAGVRPAIEMQAFESVTANTAASRKGSGVFVRTVINQRAPAVAETTKPRSTQTALTPGSSTDAEDADLAHRKTNGVIRTAIAPTAGTVLEQAAGKVQMRSVLLVSQASSEAAKQAASADGPRDAGVTVRSVLIEKSSIAPEGAENSTPHPQQTIRPAFNPPATQ